MPKALMEILKTKIAPPNAKGCRLWTGATFGNGYGQIKVTIGGRRRAVRVHRLVFGLFKSDRHGDIPPGVPPPEAWRSGGLDVLHTCDTPLCCELNHLYEGTAKHNAEDRERRKRRTPARGHRNGSAKLSEADVQTIRGLLASGVSQSECARRFGVSVHPIHQVAHGRTWQHVT